MLWVEGAPDATTEEGLAALPAFVDRYITAICPPSSPTNATQERIRELCLSVQQHRHTATCRKGGGHYLCRFAYPKPVSSNTRLKTNADMHMRR